MSTIRVRPLPSLTDGISNFENLRENVGEQLQLGDWIVRTSNHSLYIFDLNKKPSGNLSIRTTININTELNVKVFGDDDDEVLFTLKLYRWPQLQKLIEQFSDNVDDTLECSESDDPDGDDDLDSDMHVSMDSGTCRPEFKDENGLTNDDATFEFCAINAQMDSDHIADPSKEVSNCTNEVIADETKDSLPLLIVESELADSEKPEDVPLGPPYACSECDKSYDQNAKLTQHKRIHRSHFCPQCNETFIGRVDKHMRQHFPKKSYPCYICGSTFQKQGSYDKHMRTKHGNGDEEEFYCDMCTSERTNFKTKMAIERHMRQRHSDFGKNIENYQQEYVRMHEERIRKELSADDKRGTADRSEAQSDFQAKNCTTCDETFSTQTQWARHMKLHEGSERKRCQQCNKYCGKHCRKTSVVCDTCGSVFAGKGTLHAHITAKHTASEKLYCNICRNGREFKSRAYLKKHLLAHARAGLQKTESIRFEPTVYECNRCHEKFPSKFTLKTHTTLQHSDVNGTQYKCKVCDKIFGIKSLLTQHEQLHTGIVLICHLCGQSFKHSKYLKKHLNRHESPPEKKPCTMCDKQYANGFDLRLHMKKVHGIIVIPKRNGPIVN